MSARNIKSTSPDGSGGSSNQGFGIRNNGQDQTQKNSFSHLLQKAKKRIFTANHLMIKAFFIHPFVFFSILLVEYLQLTYYSFHSILIDDDYSNTSEKTQPMNIGTSNAMEHQVYLNWNSDFNILKILNYHLMILEARGQGSIKNFQISLYLHLSIFIVLLGAVLMLGSKNVMRAEAFDIQARHRDKKKNIENQSANQGQGIGDSDREVRQQDKRGITSGSTQDFILGILVFLVNSILVIPTFYQFTAIFNCDAIEAMSLLTDEITGVHYYDEDFSCLSINHIIMIAVSIVMAMIALVFIGIEYLLFQDLNMKSKLPWRQISNRIHHLKLISKLQCCLFSQDILTERPIALGIFTFYQLIILVKRYQITKIYWTPYRNWVLFTEFSGFWFSFLNFLQRTTDFNINIYMFSILIVGGFFPFYFLMHFFYVRWKHERIFLNEKQSLKELGSEVQVETYFAYMLDLIKRSQNDEQSKTELYGIMRVHWYNCKKKNQNDNCLCELLVSRIDDIEDAIDNEILSRNDQFDVIKVQEQIVELEEEIHKQEEEQVKGLRQMQGVNKMSVNIDALMHELRKNEQKLDSSRQFLKPESGPFESNSQKISGFNNIDFEHDSADKASMHGGANSVYNYKEQSPAHQRDLASAENRKLQSLEKSNPSGLNSEQLAERERKKMLLKRGSFKKKVKTLFYRHVYQMLEEALVLYPFSFRLQYLGAYIQYYLLQNEIKGLFEILMLEKRNKIPLEWQFIIFKVKIEIEDYMDYVHRQRSSNSGRIDVKKVYLFAKQLQEFEYGIETISDKCLDFWKELLKKSDFDANNLHKVGTEITMMNLEIFNLVNGMFAINPHHGYLLRIYALFTQKVMNNDEDSEKYFQKFMNAQKTFQSYEAATLLEELVKNFSGNIKYVVVVMRVSTRDTGIVEDINHEVRNVLGYRRNEIIGRNLATLMPRCVANLHDQFVQNYLDTAKPKVLNKQREVFALKKNGFIQQVFIFATSVPMIEKEGIKFVGFIKQVDEKKHTDLLPPPQEFQFKKSIQILSAPNGNIYGFNEQAYKQLGLPKYFTDDSDNKHSDYNMQYIICDYNKVLFECFKQAPQAIKAVLDTENLKPFIVPDMHSKHDMTHIKQVFGAYDISIQAQPLDFGFKGGAYLPMIIFRIYLLNKCKRNFDTISTLQTLSMKDSLMFQTQPTKPGLSKFSSLKANQRQTGVLYQEDIIMAIDEEEDENSAENYETVNNYNLASLDIMIRNKKEIEIEKFLESSASSMSASNEARSTDLSRLREFRKMVNSRKEPQTVVFLRRFVIFITALIIAIVSINIAFKISFFQGITTLTNTTLLLSEISMQLFEIHSSFRSLINLQNNMQNDMVIGQTSWGGYSAQLRETVAQHLFDLNANKNLLLDSPTRFKDQFDFYAQDILMLDLQSDAQIIQTKVNLNLAMGQLVAKGNSLIQKANTTSIIAFRNRTLVEYIAKISLNLTSNQTLKYAYAYGQFGNEIDQTTKDLHFIQENIFDTVTAKCEHLLDKAYSVKLDFISEQEILFIALISTVLLISVISILLIFYFVKQIHKTRIQSLSLYSELNIEDVEVIIQDLSVFMRVIKNSAEDVNMQLMKGEAAHMESSGDEMHIEDEDQFQDDYDKQDETNLAVSAQFSSHKDHRKSIHQNHKNKKKMRFDALRSIPQDATILENQNVGIVGSISSMNQSQKDKTKSLISSQAPSVIAEYPQEDNSYDTSRVLDDPNLSQREFKPQQRPLHQIQKRLTPPMIDAKGSIQIADEVDEKKVGNLDKFKMVRSNSGFTVLTQVTLLFTLVLAIAITNFAYFEPMYTYYRDAQDAERVMLGGLRAQYKVYLQVVQDLVKGRVEDKQDQAGYSMYEHYMQERFDQQYALNKLYLSSTLYLDKTIKLLGQMNTYKYCDVLEENYPESESIKLNITFCRTYDNAIAQDKGFAIQSERVLGELQKMRLSFISTKDPNVYLQLLSEPLLPAIQLLHVRLLRPTFSTIQASIAKNMQEHTQMNQNVDVSLIVVFIALQLLILTVAWPRFLGNMNNQMSKSRGILTLIPSRLIISNSTIKQIIEQNKLLTR